MKTDYSGCGDMEKRAAKMCGGKMHRDKKMYGGKAMVGLKGPKNMPMGGTASSGTAFTRKPPKKSRQGMRRGPRG